MLQHKSGGFTLIELLIVVLVMGVVVTTAVPSFSAFLERQRIAAQAEALSGALRTARSEALTRLETVDVCWNKTTTDTAFPGFDLEPGKLAILAGNRTDLSGNAVDVIRDIPFSSAGLYVDDTEADGCVSFLSSGRVDTASASGGFLVLGVCKELGQTSDSKAVILNATGRSSTTDNNGGSRIDCR